ncbi:aminoglycoside phosphotransferase [Jeotgalicoccus coquinae]|uniref:Aminoglycoside phosphotransferase (APT) family kinase protein n=1 Tax=Jeotgalicoccus coquinae TaxID=709509 RepID=A0A6V7RSX1_9STAP|nr:phosphotransferase [Jeotgalicoccus coquinae]MBB6423235.1 aminoglycoside phosphotransferase (APT) family kinase protein [Jeotgalicoccus coquinae]GGE09598.1 aminoglycoside phosphotransferase [Jeotgalicoccus coquinae]CAD2081915.1 Phosphotransferase enzyme family protein [Jeotgalicoccus coquinae]
MSETMINSLTSELPLKNIQSVTPFNKGWSNDRKFIVVSEDKKYLLRVTDIKNNQKYLEHADLLKQSRKNNIHTHKLAAQGECLNGTYYFLLLDWIDGNDASDVINNFTLSEQYNFGVKAGEILAEIHNFKPVSKSTESWSTRYNRKIDKKIIMYNDCELKYDKGHLLMTVISKYRHLIDNNRNVQHHGDYHIGNMLIDSNNKLHIIDFDRHDTGEAFEEFNRITWCASASPAFASGRIDGYFNYDVPAEFWELLQLYIASNMLSSLPWAIRFGDKEIKTMRRSYAEILDWYDDFELTVPKWYRKKH